jgi:hypothetical protein
MEKYKYSALASQDIRIASRDFRFVRRHRIVLINAKLAFRL